MLRKFWVFDDWEKKDSQVVPPLLIYADLLSIAEIWKLLKFSMNDISLDLSSKLPAEQINVIHRVVHTAESLGLTRLFIVGAQALDLILQHAYNLPIHRANWRQMKYGRQCWQP